jgi:excisionase family DNA binding protein
VRSQSLESLPEFLTPEEFREYVNLGRSTVYDLLRREEIPHVRFGRCIRIPKAALQRARQPEVVTPMRGSLKKRSGSWSIILELGFTVVDPVIGRRKRRQKWITVHGTKRDAERRLSDLLSEYNHGTFIAPNKLTVGQWLLEWVEKAIKPPMRTARSYETYRSVIDRHLVPALGGIRVQALTSLDLERLYAEKATAGLAPATLEKIHNIMHGALAAAIRARLVTHNVAKLVVGKPHAPAGHAGAIEHCWTAEEAATFLVVAKAAGSQPAAFYTLALDSGMRKSELCGLLWADVDLTDARIRVRQQLLTGGASPTFVPVKGKQARTIDIAPETVELLKTHRKQQAALKMRNRLRYRDHGLVFAKQWSDVGRTHDVLGDPLQVNNLGQREYASLIKAADVRPIKFHGLRHTCATLLLAAEVPSKVV